jgi:sulfite dehydrogenase
MISSLVGVITALADPALKPVDTTEWKLPAEPFTLKEAPGLALVRGNCLLCHSTEYISTQPPLRANQWQAEVLKMKGKFGAPIATNDIPELVDYLVRVYGTPATPPIAP